MPVLALVEIIGGLQTADETVKKASDLAKAIGKTPIAVKNSPGFVVNRILVPMINEAVMTLQEGVASAEDIDTAMKLGTNQPLGPLALADLIGLDTVLSIMKMFVDRLRRSEIPARAAASGDGGRGASRPQDRRGISFVLVASSARERHNKETEG